jgi:ABC-type glycerol-3-phosphate transport system substrate-binding protein
MLLCTLALAACSNKLPESQAKADDVATPFDALRASEQRAKDVQKVVDKQAAEQRKKIEAQEQQERLQSRCLWIFSG